MPPRPACRPFSGPDGPLLSYALHRSTNPRNEERHWYPYWNEFLNRYRVSHPNALMIAPEHPLFVSGTPKSQIKPLTNEIAGVSSPDGMDEGPASGYTLEGSNTSEQGDSDVGSNYSDDGKGSEEGNAEPREESSQEDNGENDNTGTVEDKIKGRRKLKEDEKNFSDRPRRQKKLAVVLGSQDDPSNHPDAAPDNEATTLLNSSRPESALSVASKNAPSDASKRASFRDSYYYVDFTLLGIDDLPSEPQQYYFGLTGSRHEVHCPIMIEIKKLPPRSLPKKATFQDGVPFYVEHAREDIAAKAPALFLCYPSQKSVIGIASSGPFWSFTIALREDKVVAWSKIFCCTTPVHHDVLRELLRAAANSPQNPAGDRDGLVIDLLGKHKLVQSVREFADILAGGNVNKNHDFFLDAPGGLCILREDSG